MYVTVSGSIFYTSFCNLCPFTKYGGCSVMSESTDMRHVPTFVFYTYFMSTCLCKSVLTHHNDNVAAGYFVGHLWVPCLEIPRVLLFHPERLSAEVSLANTCSHAVGSLFILRMVSLAVQKPFNLI